jgi:hypothetical protein
VASGISGETRYISTEAGAVPNSYRYRAETDRLDVVAAEGRVVLVVSRVGASVRSHGRGDCANRCLTAGQVRRAAEVGERYSSAVLVAIRAQVRLEWLARAAQQRPEAPQARGALDAAEQVELDAALEAGWVDAPETH